MTWCLVLAALVVNEVLYDPSGSDSGREFVELLHTDSTTASWDHLTLQAGDGAHPQNWRTVWEAGDVTLQAGELLLVGGEQVTGASEALRGSLQNGPDALRLLHGNIEIDRLGYGDLDDASLYEGSPAEDVSGASLARIPDGRDTQNNAADFRAQAPTPGRRNLPLREWSVSLRQPQWYRFWPQRLVHVTGVVINRGVQPSAAADWRLTARLTPLTQWEGAWVPEDGSSRDIAISLHRTFLESGDSLLVDLAWRAQTGVFELELRAAAGDDWPVDNVALLRGRVGAGAVVLNEVLYAPRPDEPEWIELWNRSTAAVSLQGWSLQDASGRRGLLSVASPLPAGAFAIAREQAGPPGEAGSAVALQVAVHPWLSLNNTNGENGIADVLILRDAEGLVQDAMFYSDGNTVRGRSLERVSADPDVRGLVWRLCKDPRGTTPGRENSVAGEQPQGGRLDLAPNPFTPDGDGNDEVLQVSFQVPESAEGFRLRVFDLHGRLRRVLAGDRLGPGPRRLIWDGEDDSGIPVELGVYVFHLEFLMKSGGLGSRVVRTVGVVRP